MALNPGLPAWWARALPTKVHPQPLPDYSILTAAHLAKIPHCVTKRFFPRVSGLSRVLESGVSLSLSCSWIWLWFHTVLTDNPLDSRTTIHSCISTITGVGKAALHWGLERTPVLVCMSAQVGDNLLI